NHFQKLRANRLNELDDLRKGHQSSAANGQSSSVQNLSPSNSSPWVHHNGETGVSGESNGHILPQNGTVSQQQSDTPLTQNNNSQFYPITPVSYNQPSSTPQNGEYNSLNASLLQTSLLQTIAQQQSSQQPNQMQSGSNIQLLTSLSPQQQS